VSSYSYTLHLHVKEAKRKVKISSGLSGDKGERMNLNFHFVSSRPSDHDCE